MRTSDSNPKQQTRIERDTRAAFGSEADRLLVSFAKDESSFDWGTIRFRYAGLNVELWRDRGTIEAKVSIEGVPPFDVYDIKTELSREKRPPQGMALNLACEWLISHASDIGDLLSAPEGVTRVVAASEVRRAATAKELGLE